MPCCPRQAAIVVHKQIHIVNFVKVRMFFRGMSGNVGMLFIVFGLSFKSMHSSSGVNNILSEAFLFETCISELEAGLFQYSLEHSTHGSSYRTLSESSMN